MSNKEQTSSSKGPLMLPLALAVLGGLLLFRNFLLLDTIEIIDLWPLLLVFLGAVVLLQGDFLPANSYRTFGITRGSLESATIEINAGDIDVNINALPEDNLERLIAGQYAHQSRPELLVSSDTHAHLLMERHRTPWLTFADWDAALSRELPWQIVSSSSIGQATINMEHLIIQNALINTGIGDVQVVLPAESFEAIYVRSLLGHITIQTPQTYHVRIAIEAGHFFGVNVDETRYEMVEDGVYMSRDADDELPLVDVVVSGTFGDVYLT